jgi:short-subunit dehydrogenase
METAMEGKRPLAIVTGASSGIGLHLALEAAHRGYDLVLAADEPLAAAEEPVRTLGTQVDCVQTDLALVQRVAREMRRAMHGKILITGSIAGFMPGTFQAVYNGSKAFLDSFSYALRNELKDTGVTVTCLMPGATDTAFFKRTDLLDTKVGADERKADPADVARTGFNAMEKGEAGVVAGLSNKLRVALAGLVPETMLAEQHRKMAEPGSAHH